MDETLEQQPVTLRVSAILVSYNCAAALRRALAALEGSRERERLEILVVDNGSSDDSSRMDAEFPDITVLRLERHFGMAKSLNIAMRTAQADYLLFVDPNVEVPPSLVSALADRLDSDAEAMAVSALAVDPEGRPASVFRKLPAIENVSGLALEDPPGSLFAPDLSGEPVSVPASDWSALMVRKFFIRGLNYFDERFGHHLLDIELGFQIRRAARKTILLPRVTAVRHPAEPSFTLGNSARAALEADRALAAATFAGKHFGFVAGLKLRLGLAFGSIGRFLRALVTFGDTGFEFSRMSAIVSGQKIDGSQRAL